MEWLLTWLWQGSALALLVACLLRATSSTNASTRYLIWWATLLAVLLLPCAGRVWVASSAIGPDSSVWLIASPRPPAVLPVTLPLLPAWLIVAATGAWLGVAALRLAGVVRAIGHLQRLKGRCAPVLATREDHLPLWLSVRDAGRTARLCLSDDVAVASVLGLARPIIAVPRSLMDALTDEELDQIVLHEYGHVQRRDDWARLAQVLIEAPCAIHPAVWWIGRALDLEREVACDDWVVTRCRAPRAYASCLTKVASIASSSAPVLAPGAARSGGEITRRVERLLDKTRNASIRPSRVALALGVSVLVAVVGLFGRLSPVLAVSSPDPALDVASAPMSELVDLEDSSELELSNSPVVAEDNGRSQLALGNQVAVGASTLMPVDASSIPLPPSLPLRGLTDVRQALMASAGPNRDAPLSAGTEPRERIATPRTAGDPESPTDQRPGPPVEDDPTSDRRPWSTLADAGIAVGAGATKAGVATAGAFTRLGASFTSTFSSLW